jgi:hypothetical protein
VTEPTITCACCGYVTITDQFDGCPICRWTHDPVQESDPDTDDGGPNYVTVREAQANYSSFGASSRKRLPGARKPGPTDRRDPDWKPLA